MKNSLTKFAWLFSARFCLLSSLLFTGLPAAAQTSDVAFSQQIASFLDEWHDEAAHADLAYFDKMASDGVYIGTDKSERWVRDDFKNWAKPFFERKKAWEFHAFNRHVAYSDDRSIIWFDEQLHTQMGICQASGVIKNTKQGFKIALYQLSLTVPNDLVEQVKKQIDDEEAQAKKK